MKSSLHAFAARDLPHHERRVEAAVALGDNHAFVRLSPFALAFDHAQIISAATQPYITPADTSQSVGDGLSLLSDLPYSDFERVPWTACYGVLDSGSDHGPAPEALVVRVGDDHEDLHCGGGRIEMP